MVPGLMIESKECRRFIERCLQNELLGCLIEIRKGLNYKAPCNVISSLLSNFANMSSEHLPYAFYRKCKTVGLALTSDVDKPVVTIKLKGMKGAAKELLLVSTELHQLIIDLYSFAPFVYQLMHSFSLRRDCKF